MNNKKKNTTYSFPEIFKEQNEGKTFTRKSVGDKIKIHEGIWTDALDIPNAYPMTIEDFQATDWTEK